MSAASTEFRDCTVPLPAKVRKGWGRDAGWTATFLGLVQGHGKTQAEAKASLASNAEAIVRNAYVEPVVVIDDLGATCVYTAAGDGYMVTRISGGTARVTCVGTGSPSEAADNTVRWQPGSVRLPSA